MICEGCGKPIPQDHGRAKVRRFCDMRCGGPTIASRSLGFAEGTSRAPGKPADGVTYGKGKVRDGG